MSLYAIGDLHLSLGTDKPMDVFGGGWNNYTEKIKLGFSKIRQDDTCVLCGDLSWGMSLDESLRDFMFINDLPGKKIILKGNHDYWWTTAAKMRKFFNAYNLDTLEILNNNCFRYGETAVCGTRGWFYEEETGAAHDKKIMAREVMRLEASLKSAGDAPVKLCFLHYPPKFKNYECKEIINVMRRYGAKECWYGHIHSSGHRWAVNGERDGINYHLISADYINFSPVKVAEISDY